MIFYFSGTGNSLYASKKLASENEKIINIIDAIESKQFIYNVEPNEKIGFVFPVYFYTLNDVLVDFISNLTLQNATYIYAVVTCGASIGGTGSVLKNKLKKRGLHLSNVYPLVMPDNGVFYYNLVTMEKALEQLKKSDLLIDEIKKSIEKCEIRNIKRSMIAPFMSKIYHLGKTTKKFYVTNDCISCGLCEKKCQEHVIKVVDGNPKWIKPKCSKCSACINYCPKTAIQYGKSTKKRNRYINPYV